MNAKEHKENTLGTLIRLERQKSGLTQAQLGKLIGLGESRVSKIENGAPITPEVADYILEKMGSKLQLKVLNKNADEDSTGFLTSVVYHFSKIKSLSLSHAFRYLRTFKGFEYLAQFIDIERTLSYSEITENLTLVCARNGGTL